MKRRAVIGGLAMLAGSAAACGSGGRDDNAAKRNTGEKDTAKPSNIRNDRAKLRVGFVGLCAFVQNLNDKYYKVGLIDPTSLKDPDDVNFKPHQSSILIDSSYVTGGTQITGADLRELRLNTSVTSFQMWPLNGFNVGIGGLPTATGETYASLTGAIPLADVHKGTLVTDWDKQTWVQSMMPILSGSLFSGRARVDADGVYKCHWKLTGAKAKNQTEWKAIADLPRLLSDVTEYHSDVPPDTTITLTERKAQNPQTIRIPTTAKTELEIWILNMPKIGDHTQYEMLNPHELQHVAGFYQLFTMPPTPMRVPITDPSGYPTSDPIFCPPGSIP